MSDYGQARGQKMKLEEHRHLINIHYDNLN